MDIAQRGVLVPVETDEQGNVLDGHHRAMIADELGIRYRKIRRKFDSERAKVEHALKLNLLRRNLGPVAWAEAFRKLCRARGVRLGNGQQKSKSVTVSLIAKELGVLAVLGRTIS